MATYEVEELEIDKYPHLLIFNDLKFKYDATWFSADADSFGGCEIDIYDVIFQGDKKYPLLHDYILNYVIDSGCLYDEITKKECSDYQDDRY